MLTLDHSARIEVQAPLGRCLDLLGAVERYPDWASLIESAASLPGDEARVRIRAEVLGLGLEMDCVLELGPDGGVLRRLPYDASDDERYEATWTLRPRGGAATDVELHVAAALDAPRPAALLRGRVQRRLVDELLADFGSGAERG